MTADTTPPTEREYHHLREAAAHRHGGVDLRFEGGPWISELDALVAKGWLECREHGYGYMVGYFLTERGRALLAAADDGTT